MKKIISLAMTLVMVFSLLGSVASAANVDHRESEIVTQRYAYLSNCWAGLNPTGGGWYNVTGGAGSALGYVKITVTVSLQRFNLQAPTGWDDLVTLTDAAPYSASCGTSWYIATPGTYRTHTVVTVNTEDGSFGESAIANSDRITIS